VNKATGIALLTSVALVSAQSLFGLKYPGGLSSTKTGLASRLGGAGIGMEDPYLLMAHTPGNLGNINQSVYTLKLSIDYNRIKQNDLQNDFLRVVPDLVGFAFPLGPVGTVGVGFSKERGNDYYYKSAEGILARNPITNDSITGWTGFNRKSGITIWEAGWGHSALKMVRPGISYRRFYYSVEDSRVTKINNFGGTSDSLDIKQAGNAIRGGISGTIGKVSYGVNATYNFSGDVTLKTTVLDIDSSKSKVSNSFISKSIHANAPATETYTLQLPPSGGVGVSYKASEKLVVAADASMEMWEQAWTDAPKSVFYTTYQNALSASVGAQFIPAPELLSPRYFEKMRYSGGVRFSQLPVEGDFEFALNAGLGLPLGTSGLVDIAFEGGARRSEILPDYKENFFKFSFTTSGGKAWKKKPAQVY